MSSSYDVDFIVRLGSGLSGEVAVPGDKSISHRAVMLGAIADGETEIVGLLEGEDVLATIRAMREMGVEISDVRNDSLTIQGVGLHGLSAPERPLDMGNSGTAMRLLIGILAGQQFASEVTGDESLLTRPMERVATPLREMGARVETTGGRPPVRIEPAPDGLHGASCHLPVASAQLKSALLLAGLYAQGETRVLEPSVTRDHTERMLKAFGCRLLQGEGWVSLSGGQAPKGTRIEVPGDLSSAAFFLVGAAILPGSDLILHGVGVNPTRTGILDILRSMGANIERSNDREISGEPIADLRIRGGTLRGVSIPASLVPLAIDEFPAICIAAAAAEGVTSVRGAGELRVKESDRIDAMAVGLRILGVKVDEFDDGLSIHGGTVGGGEVDSRSDHRIAMSFAMAGLVAQGPIRIRGCRNVATSFPDFVKTARDAGLGIEEILHDSSD